MSTVGGAIIAIPFQVEHQRNEGAVTRLFKEVLDLMYLVQERMKPITESAASSFLSSLQTKLRLVTPGVPIYNTLVSNIIESPKRFIPALTESNAVNSFMHTQVAIVENIAQQELRANADRKSKKSTNGSHGNCQGEGKGG